MRKIRPARAIGIALMFLLLLLLAAGGWFLYDLPRVTHTKIPPETSRIYVAVDIDSPRHEEKLTEIVDPEDVRFLRALFGKSYEAVFDAPICPFGANRIRFEDRGERIDFYPTMDGCEFIRYGKGKKLFVITREEKRRLTELLRTYGAHHAPS